MAPTQGYVGAYDASQGKTGKMVSAISFEFGYIEQYTFKNVLYSEIVKSIDLIFLFVILKQWRRW